jgi:hypothetical protein
LHRAPRLAATTANFTGALWRETLVPELSVPVSVPFATTPVAVARKLVIFAVSESLDDAPPVSDEPEFALAGGTRTAVIASIEKATTTSLRIVYLLDG